VCLAFFASLGYVCHSYRGDRALIPKLLFALTILSCQLPLSSCPSSSLWFWWSFSPRTLLVLEPETSRQETLTFSAICGSWSPYIAAGVLSVSEMWMMTMIREPWFWLSHCAICWNPWSRKFLYRCAARSLTNNHSCFWSLATTIPRWLPDPAWVLPLSFQLGKWNLMTLHTHKPMLPILITTEKISFDEFNHWWSMGYVERGRKRQDDGEESTWSGARKRTKDTGQLSWTK
jgi:hypothetical protein